jgi:hypothetical protein
MTSYTKKRWDLCLVKKHTKDWRLEGDKILAKQAASAMGVRVPRDLITGSFVVKPNDQSSAHGVTVMHNGVPALGPSKVIVEELVVDEDGSVPPRDFKIYTFGHRPRLVQVVTRQGPRVELSQYSPAWEHLPGLVRKDGPQYPRPACLSEMLAAATTLSGLFHFPVRVDMYASDNGAVFGEFCLSSGATGYLTQHGDELLGRWWDDHFREIGVADEFDPKAFSAAYDQFVKVL